MIKFDLNLLFGIIDIIVFYLIMRKFLFGRIKKVMDARKELIASQLKEAEDKSREADEKLQAYEEQIKNSEAEGKALINDAKSKADAEYKRIVEEADAEAQSIRENARALAEADKEKALRESREEIAALAMQAAEKVIGSSVSEKENSAIFDEFLNEGKHE